MEAASTPSVYAALGLRPVLNAATTLTALGGTILPPEVVAAMSAASTSCVSMEELHIAAGHHLATMTGNEAALVTSGCASAMVLGVLACITGGRPELIAQLHHDNELARDVVIHCAHRIPYDRAIELAGARILQIGNAIQTFTWELEAALTERTAAVFWVAGDHMSSAALSLDETVSIAHARGVPVIVDAAAQLPPVSNLWNFTTVHGADLATFSGGKGLQGPQASGIMVGRTDLIEAARLNAAPFQRLARPMKVGKEEICGLVAAVERYLSLDHDEMWRTWSDTVDQWVAGLSSAPGVHVQRRERNEAGQPVPRVEICFVDSDAASRVVERLWDDTPRVAVLQVRERLYVTPDTLPDGTNAFVLDRLTAAISPVG